MSDLSARFEELARGADRVCKAHAALTLISGWFLRGDDDASPLREANAEVRWTKERDEAIRDLGAALSDYRSAVAKEGSASHSPESEEGGRG